MTHLEFLELEAGLLPHIPQRCHRIVDDGFAVICYGYLEACK